MVNTLQPYDVRACNCSKFSMCSTVQIAREAIRFVALLICTMRNLCSRKEGKRNHTALYSVHSEK